jgi:Tol biopolymer transport system component
MSLSIGTKLGSVEVLAVIGRGGMGEVYRARDTKLKRDVAIKTLPDEFSHDADRLSRFQREAEVLASLNHPNIAAIYDLQEAEGARFLVLELVEGETLADRIARGPIPIDEALQIAKNICEALEAAHEKSIVHRDLKPANVKITPDGKVKVLDFGLAKGMSGTATATTLSNSPTLVSGSMGGAIIGTAAYMSPEQARGMTVDRRTDIFAFGCVLYEMLTGQQAFQGGTVSDILAAVLKMEPDWNRFPHDTPIAIRRLLRRCMQKEHSRRMKYAEDVRIEIEEVRTESERVDQPADLMVSRSGGRLGWMAAALSAVIMVAVILAAPYFRAPAELREMRTEIVTPATTDPISFAISPNGRRLVFVAAGQEQPQLWLRQLDATVPQQLAGTEGARQPFWSPDSQSVGFFAGGKLKRIDIAGGPPQTLADAAPGWGGSWSSDNLILFASTINSPLLRVPASGGEAEPLTLSAKIVNQYYGYRLAQFLPDGRQFLFYVQGTEDTRGIYLGSLDSAEPTRLTAADSGGAYMPPGWLLFMRQGTLVARRFDLARRELHGDAVTMADSIGLDSNGNVGAFSVSATGLVAYRTGAVSRSQLTWFDRTGKTLGTFGVVDDNNLQYPELSPDGRRVAVRRTVQNNQDIYLLDAVGPTRFTFTASGEQYQAWSPDGNWIAFGSNRKGVYDLYKKPSSGGNEELLVESPQVKNLDDWSPDGRSILYSSEDPKSGRDLWVLPLDRDGKPGKPIEFLKTNFQEHRGRFSPDGQWVAYVSDQSGQPDIWVRPFPPGPGGEWQVSVGGGVQPRWRRDGKELYYIAPDGRLMAVPVMIKGAVFERGAPVPLFGTRIAGTNAYTRQQYDVAADGRFLFDVTTEDGATSPITLLQNWKPPAK